MVDQPIDVGPFALYLEHGDAWFCFQSARPAPSTYRCDSSIDTMSQLLHAHRTHLQGRRLIADLQDVPVIDSTHIGALLALRKACKPFGGLALAHVSDPVARLLRITSIDRLFETLQEPFADSRSVPAREPGALHGAESPGVTHGDARRV